MSRTSLLFVAALSLVVFLGFVYDAVARYLRRRGDRHPLDR